MRNWSSKFDYGTIRYGVEASSRKQVYVQFKNLIFYTLIFIDKRKSFEKSQIKWIYRNLVRSVKQRNVLLNSQIWSLFFKVFCSDYRKFGLTIHDCT